MLTNLLSAMVASATRSALERQRSASRPDVERHADARQPRGDAFRETLRAPGIRIIAECKRRSPSRGVLRPQYDPAGIAKGYDVAGAAAISVLTEAAFFDGSLDHLRAVRNVTDLPLLRKDFVVDDFQLIEARAAGADAVLLIVAALDDDALAHLLSTAASLGLAALVEVHDFDERTRALQAGAVTIGVNSRNLRTLEVHPSVLDELVRDMPDHVVAVAESGLKSADDLRRLRTAGYDGFLMGERFMTATDPGAALAEIRAMAVAELERRP